MLGNTDSKEDNSMEGWMKAVVVEAPDQFQVKQVPIPAIGPDQVLIRVTACAVCGSDPMIVHGVYPAVRYPLIPGHEIGGVVAEIGDEVTSFSIGDRVTMESHEACGKCINCMRGYYTTCLNYGNLEAGHRQVGFTANGGYAEYVAVAERCVHRLPDGVDFDQAPIAQAAAVVLFGLRLAGGIFPLETVAILGPGLIGLIAVQIAKASSASKVILTGTREERLQMGLEMGADEVYNARETDVVSAVMARTGGVGADFVIEVAGSPESVSQAIDMCRWGGRVLLLGISKEPATINSARIPLGSITVYGSRGEGMWAMKEALALLAQGKIRSKELITHRFPLDDFETAIETAEKRLGGAIRVIVEP